MANKIVGVTKAAIAGAIFGTAVGMVSVPRAKSKKRHHRSTIADKTSATLRTVGVTMQSVADMIEK